MELKKYVGELKSLWPQYLTRLRGKKWIGLLLLLGILLVSIPSSNEENLEVPQQEIALGAFQLAAEEERISLALSEIEGAGEVTVLLSIQSGGRSLLAEETKLSEDEKSFEEERTPLVLDTDARGEEVVTLQEIYPSYTGALVISDGGDNPKVRLALTQAVAALTGLGTNKISICNRGK